MKVMKRTAGYSLLDHKEMKKFYRKNLT